MDRFKEYVLQNAATSTGNGNAIWVTDAGDGAFATVVAQVTIADTATITWEGTLGKSATQTNNTWVAIPAVNISTDAQATTATASGVYRLNVIGMAQVRARISSHGAGAVTVRANAIRIPSDVPASIAVDNLNVPGSYDEDAGHTTGDTGLFVLAVRKDTATALAGSDADYIPLITDSSGRLWAHVGAIDAGTNLLGRISASHETSTIYNGTTALTPKFAKIDAATSGDNTLVAAVTDKKIRVLQVMLMAAGTVTVRFESGASGTALSGQMELTAQTGFVLPYAPVGWFETASNTLLNLELSGAVSVDGLLVYVEV